MGGSYSDLNVYFKYEKDQPYGNGYKVTRTQKILEVCSDFQVINHTIQFTNEADGLNYNVILYDGKSETSKGNYIFGYYYPRDKNQVIKEVQVYYSVLAPDSPLVISFIRPDNTYHCYFSRLKEAEWDRAYNIDWYSFRDGLSKNILYDEFDKRSRKRKIQFKIGKSKTEIFGDIQELGNMKSFRFIFTPKGDVSVLGSDYLFAIDFNKKEPISKGDPNPEIPNDCRKVQFYVNCKKKHGKEKCIDRLKYPLRPQQYPVKHPNQVDEYYIRPFKDKLYDGIMVYFERNKQKEQKTFCGQHTDNNKDALLLEFIESSKHKTWLKRLDEQGCLWSEELAEYTSDQDLSKKLSEIKSALMKNVVTVILDEKRQYKGLEKFIRGEKGKACTKYTYQFGKANKPTLVFDRKKITTGKLGSLSNLVKTVEVIYLTAKGTDDEQPFLIVFYDDRIPSFKEAYHFNNSYKFNDWVKFEFDFKKEQGINPRDDVTQDLKKKLDDKINKIENLKCLDNLNLLRFMAYTILIDPEISHTEKKEKVDPRPPIKVPETVAKKYTIEIVLGSVGGGVFVISSTVGYGIYWYNTTIKLLT